MSLVKPEQERELIAEIKRAGEILLRLWPGRSKGTPKESGLHIETKADGSLVTEADFASNQTVIAALQKLFPGDSIFSEELPADPSLAEKERVWIIDPLDGTKSYVDGNDDFSILVSLCIGTTPRFGVMFFPARNCLAVGRAGEGAYLDADRLTVSSTSQPRARSIYLRHLALPSRDCFYDRWMDSGLAFLKLAEGELDGIILKIVNHREWDLAAPSVMLHEAGGRISDEHGNPIHFNKGAIQYRYFVASNGRVHDELLSMIPDV